MSDARRISPKKLEAILGVTISEVSNEVNKGIKDIYATYRSKNIDFYRVMLLGVRVLKSNLTTKEFIRMLEDAEALKGSS